MKKKGSLFSSFHISIQKKMEPCLQWKRNYPLSHIPLILLIQEGEEAPIVEKRLLKKGSRLLEFFPMINAFYGMIPKDKLKEIANMPSIRYIAYNHRVQAFIQGGLNGPGKYQPNFYGVSGRGVVVAHLDTGIHPHGDFIRPRRRLLTFHDFINNAETPYDDHGHGTLCAGCIAGNGLGSKGTYRGLASDCLLIGLKCLNQGGTGDIRSVLSALQWVHDNRDRYSIRVVHIPFGVYHPFPLGQDPLIMAVERLWDEGLVVVCAAGNNGPHRASIASPGTSSKVITVGSYTNHAVSTDPTDICPFSSRGPTFDGSAKPDLVAPGREVPSTYHRAIGEPGGYLSFSGTSASSSIVAGAVALLLEKHPALTPSEVKLALELSCSSLHAEKNAQGRGMLDIHRLLQLDLNGGDEKNLL